MGGQYRKFWTMGLALAFFGCDSLTDLEVINQNNPETERVLATAADLEALIGGTFLTYWDNTQHFYPFGLLAVIGDENSVSWGNWGMNDAGFEPRVAFNNSSTYASQEATSVPWQGMYGALSAAADGITSINGGLEIGAGGKDNPRALAFAKFVQGISLGFLAQMFDKAIIFDEDVDLTAAAAGDFEFAPYGEVMTAALQKMDDAIAIAQANTFTINPSWFGSLSPSSTEFIKIIHSFKARMMVDVVRGRAEAATVNWTNVLAEIDAGMTEDLVFQVDPITWWSTWTNRAQNGDTWGRADYKGVGFMDKSDGYKDWLATPVGSRQEFEMDTPDLRIWGCGIEGDASPGNQCRSADGSTSRNARIGGDVGQADDQEPGLYFRFYGSSPFRVSRGTMVFSMYHHWRYEDVFVDNVGPMPHMLMAEMNLIKAEAFIETGQLPAARDIINATRVPAGLGAVDVDGQPCPVALPTCDLMDHLIYEMRLETWNTNTGSSYFDRRRWGDPAPTSTHHRGLVEWSPIQFAVPGLELEVLELPTYTFGGPPGGSPSMGIQSRMTARYEDIYAFERDMTLKEKLAFVEENFRGKRSLLTRYR